MGAYAFIIVAAILALTIWAIDSHKHHQPW